MRRVVTLLVLMSFLTFGTTRQELIVEKTLSYEGVQKYGQSVRGIELSTLKTYNKLKGTNWKLDTLKHWQAVEILKELYWYDRYNYVNDDMSYNDFISLIIDTIGLDYDSTNISALEEIIKNLLKKELKKFKLKDPGDGEIQVLVQY